MFPLLVKQVCILLGILKIPWVEAISSCAQQHSWSVAVNSEAFVWWVYAMINVFQTLEFESEPVRPRSFLAPQQS